MFGLSNNKQDNQDDQVMLKNVSQLATDLGSASSQQNIPASSQQSDDTTTRSGFPASSDDVQQDAQVATSQPADEASTQEGVAPAEDQQGVQEQATAETPSSFTFPNPQTQTGTNQIVADEEIVAPGSTEPTTEQVAPEQATEITDESSKNQEVVPEQNDNNESSNESEELQDQESQTPPSTDSESEVTEASTGSEQVPLSAPIDAAKLQAMKQQAIEHLDPLVDHLEHSPEETFKTTMMMIQANDNHTLLDKAFEAAKLIADDKLRAQAMLDIINEINYFSQDSQDS